MTNAEAESIDSDSEYDPYISICPECEKDEIGVANGRAGTYHCSNCDITIGWSSVIRMRRSRYREAMREVES